MRSVRGLLWIVVAFGVICVGGWLLATWAVRSVAETALSEVLGAPVQIGSAALGWPPSRVSLVDVRVGDAADSEMSFERLVLQAEAVPLLQGEVRDLQVEIWGPRSDTTRADLQASVLRKVAEMPVDGLRVTSVRVDAWRLGPVHAATLAPFEFREIEVSRAEGEPLRAVATFRVGGGGGDVLVDVENVDGEPFLALEANVSGLALGEIFGAVPGRPATLAGVATGHVFYRGSWQAASPEDVLGAEGSIAGFAIEDERGRKLAFEEIGGSELVVDFARREILLSGVEARGGVLTVPLEEAEAENEPTEAQQDGAWQIRIPSADIADLRVGSAEPLTVERLVVRDVGTPWQTGSIELDALTSGSRVRLVAERNDADVPGTATLSVDDFPLALLTGGLASPVVIDGGRLDLRLTLSGPPGLQGDGEALLQEFAASVPSAAGGAGEGRLLEIADLYLGAEYFSVVPPRLRVRSAQIVEPRAWLRVGPNGFELAELLEGDVSYEPPRWLRTGLAALRRWAGEAPIPETRPSAVGARLSDGAVIVADDTVDPPLLVALEDVNALVQGPAGPAGPVDLEVGARSESLGELSFRGRTGPARSQAAGELGPISLPHFNAYLEKWIGFAAETGTLGLSWNARVEPSPAMNAGLLFHDVALAGQADRDPIGRVLEVPLPEAVARVQGSDGSGRLELQLEGNAAEARYGFLSALPDALRRAVADLSPKSP